MSEAPDWSGALHYVQSFTMKWRSETVKLELGLNEPCYVMRWKLKLVLTCYYI